MKYNIVVAITSGDFMRFAIFNGIVRMRRYRLPLIFFALFMLFAAICFYFINKVQNALLLGAVLGSVGVLLPIVYFANFFYSVGASIKRFRLSKKPQHLYSITISQNTAIDVQYAKKIEHIKWSDVFAIYNIKGTIYIYKSADKALILPASCLKGLGGEILQCVLSNTHFFEK